MLTADLRKLSDASNVPAMKDEESSFFQNEEIFVQLDELDEVDRMTHA